MIKIKLFKITKKNRAALIIILVAILAVLFLHVFKNDTQTATGSKLGQYAPDFESEYLNGSKFFLHELKGKPIILNFWASWCPPCISEMPRLNEFSRMHENDILVIGVNLGEKEISIETFLARVNVTFPIVKDKERSIEKSYNIIARPSTFFIDENGIIVDKRLGEISREELNDKSQKLLKNRKV